MMNFDAVLFHASRTFLTGMLEKIFGEGVARMVIRVRFVVRCVFFFAIVNDDAEKTTTFVF